MTAALGWTLSRAAEALAAGEVTATALTEAALERVGRTQVAFNAFVYLDPAGALAAAGVSDARRAAGGALGPLDGIPLGVKDLFCTRDQPTTAGAPILEGHRPAYDATAVARLKAAGAVILGKTNLDAFGMGSDTTHSLFGPTRNPWDPARTAGGSSGGSAAAVAARLCFGALGSDTGGSVRQPAALTGTVGLKPTWGRVSRSGLIAFASSLDCPGVHARTVADAAHLLSAVAGADPADATSTPVSQVPFAGPLDLRGRRVGVAREHLEAVASEVAGRVRTALDWLRGEGAEIRELSLPSTAAALPAYLVLSSAEASSNLARYDGVRYGRRVSGDDIEETMRATRSAGFGPEVQRRILLGTWALSRDEATRAHARAATVRHRVRAEILAALEEVEVLVGPTTPTPAWRLDDPPPDPVAARRADALTVPASLAGLPALSVPCGFTGAGLPVGLQLVGRPFDESRLLGLAAAYEAAHGWHLAAPPEAP